MGARFDEVKAEWQINVETGHDRPLNGDRMSGFGVNRRQRIGHGTA